MIENTTFILHNPLGFVLLENDTFDWSAQRRLTKRINVTYSLSLLNVDGSLILLLRIIKENKLRYI